MQELLERLNLQVAAVTICYPDTHEQHRWFRRQVMHGRERHARESAGCGRSPGVPAVE